MTSFHSRARFLCAVSLLAAPALAQQASSPSEILVEGKLDASLDTVTPTGSRLGLTLRETPASVDVLTQERFLERGLRTSNEALNTATGVLAVDGGGGTNFTMRGFGGAAISTNYDGVHQPSTMTQRNYDGFAFDRIEVLKGPSSVLYGEGAIGGAINYVPKKPMLDTTAFTGLGQYGSRDTYRAAGDINLPLGQSLATRAVVSYSNTNGYIDRARIRTLTANLGALYQPADNLSILVQAEYFWNRNRAQYWGTALIPSTLAIDPSDLISTPDGRVLDNARRTVNYQYDDGHVRSRSTWLRGNLTWKISDVWTLRNDLSYNRSNRLWWDAEGYTYNATTGLINRQPVYIHNLLDFWNNRTALSADTHIAGHRNRFTIGYEHTSNDHTRTKAFGANTPTDIDNTTPGLFPALNIVNFPGGGSYGDDRGLITVDAVFAENALNVTDKLLFVAGGRYERMKLDRTAIDFNLNTTSNFDKIYRPFSYRFGAVYDLTGKTQIYGQWTQASAPVGTLVLLSLTNATFKLTKGKSAEIGLKSSLFDGRVDLTLSGYWIKQDDIITRDPSNPNISIQGGSQSSRGVEAAVVAALTKQLRIDASIALVNAHYDELIEAGGVDRKGNTPTNTPEQIVNLFGVYQFADLPVKLTAGMRYSSKLYGDNANTVRIDGNTVFDASIGYTTKYGDLTVRARNLTNKRYIEWGGSSTVYLGQPRTIDVTLRTKF